MAGNLAALADALADLPTAEGGTAVVFAAAGPPPALSLLSSGNVWLERGVAHVAVHAGSRVTRALGGSCALLVGSPPGALRVAIAPATLRELPGPLAVINGPIVEVRPSTELPWTFDMSFQPLGNVLVDEYVAYWRAVREWLSAGAHGAGPEPPSSG